MELITNIFAIVFLIFLLVLYIFVITLMVDTITDVWGIDINFLKDHKQTWYNVYKDKKIVYTTPSKKLLKEYMKHAKETDKHKYKIKKEKI